MADDAADTAESVFTAEQNRNIARSFLTEYYKIAMTEPAGLHSFYTLEGSKVNHGDVTTLGQNAIREMIQGPSWTFGTDAKVIQYDCQSAPNETGGLLVMAAGTMIKDEVERTFSQVFYLGRSELDGQVMFLIENDIFRYLPASSAAAPAAEAPETAPHSAAEEADLAYTVDESKVLPESVPEPEPEPVAEPVVAEPEPTPEPEPEPPSDPEPVEAKPEPVAEPVPVVAAPVVAKKPVVPENTKPSSWASLASKAPVLPIKTEAPPKAVSRPAKPASKTKPAPVAFGATKNNHKKMCPHPIKPKCSLYVRNVPIDCTVEQLNGVFAKAGEIRHDSKYGVCINIQLMKNPPKGRQELLSRYAFVEFDSPGSLDWCLKPENRNSFKLVSERYGGPVSLAIEERVPRTPVGAKGGGGRGAGGGGRGGDRGRGRGRGGRGLGRGRGAVSA